MTGKSGHVTRYATAKWQSRTTKKPFVEHTPKMSLLSILGLGKGAIKNPVTHDQNDDKHKLKFLASILASSEISFILHYLF